jgi:hypothetical protein
MAMSPVPSRERHSHVQNPVENPQRRHLGVFRPDQSREKLRRPRAFVIGPVLILIALLAVVAAQAVLMQGQVTLTNLQGEVASAQNSRYDLQLEIAKEEQPSTVVAGAKRDGMVVPQVLNELPAAHTSSNDTSANHGHDTSGESTGKR